MKFLLFLLGIVSIFNLTNAISYCYKYPARGGYVSDPEGDPPTIDPSCAEKKKEMEALGELPGRELPRCLANGHYDLYQCSGSQCFCVDCAGIQIEEFESFNRGQVGDSTCNCAREADEFWRSGMVGVSYRCEAQGGHYKSYQCRGTGCHCTDKNGEWIRTDDENAHFTPWQAAGKDEYCSTLA